jgi:hypothetical protein
MLRILILTLFIGVSLPFAFCEIGSKSNQEVIQGGYRVTYTFPTSGQMIALRFNIGEMMPVSVSYDFQTMRFCR